MELSQTPPVPMRPPRPAFGPSRSLAKPQLKPSVLSPRQDAGSVSPRGRVSRGKEELAPYSWMHVHMRYLPNEARDEAEAAIAAARAEAAQAREQAAKAQERCAAMEQQKKQAEEEASKRVHKVELAAVQQANAYEEQMQALERLLERERDEHRRQLQECMEQIRQIQREADQRVKQAGELCSREVSAAKAREEDARIDAARTTQRAEEELQKIRQREQERVDEVRGMADSRVHAAEERLSREVHQVHQDFARRRQEVDDTLTMSSRHKEDAMKDVQRHLTALEDEAKAVRALQELELAKRETWFHQQTVARSAQKDMVENHHKTLLDLEKGLHQRTMERTMQRITRHLQYGDAHLAGDNTPTRQVFRSMALDSFPAQAPQPG